MAVASRGNVEQNMPKLAVYGGTNYGTKAFDIASATPSYWVKIERIGNIITGYVSPDGTNWAATDVGRIDAPVPDTIYVGLVVSSIKGLNTSIFSNVQITGGDGGAPSVVPAAPAMLLASPGDGAVPLRWQASFGATSYTVARDLQRRPILDRRVGRHGQQLHGQVRGQWHDLLLHRHGDQLRRNERQFSGRHRHPGSSDGERRHGWHRKRQREHERRHERLRPEHGVGMVLQGHDRLAAI
jgi:hypothetical protein